MRVNDREKWIRLLSEEDLAFIKRFVLASGSLKQMAAAYGVSYPTVRLRLDRLIAKIEVADSETIGSELEGVLRGLYAEGKLDLATFKTLLAAHQRDKENGDANSNAAAD
jgi:hypothetical protein